MTKLKNTKGNFTLEDKYLTISDRKVIKDLSQSTKDNNVVVTCMGLYNHGKSTLLNVLVKDVNHETFKTADVRETSVKKIVQHGNIKFVDTPGLDANKNDDKRVMDAVKESDINLFVHAVTTGEFVKKEIDFLNYVKSHWRDPQEFINRTIFVVSRVDKANNEQDIVRTIEKMSQQIIEIFDSQPIIIPVSAMRYTKGKIEDKNLMIKKSNIEVLETSLHKLSDKLLNSIKEIRQIRLVNKYDELIRQLNTKVQTNKLEVAKQKQAQKQYFDALNKDIKTIEDTLTNMYLKLEDS